jgi:diguanylate cyclase (GGDEF)-like protein
LPSIVDFFDLSWEGIAFVAPEPWRIVFANATLAQWLGEPIVDRPLTELLGGITPNQVQARLRQVWQSELDHTDFSAGLIPSDKTQRPVPVEIRIVAVQLAEQRLIGMVIRKTDSTKTRLSAGRHDPLTGLADRSELLSRLETLLGGDRSADQRVAVLFIDLDHFKNVNDQYGHLVGDRALSEVARRLVHCTRASDKVYRYGGDEFVVLVEQVAGEYKIERVVARIHEELDQPFAIRNEEVCLSASIGVAEVGAAHTTPEEVLFEADRAMYAAKRRSLTRMPR